MTSMKQRDSTFICEICREPYSSEKIFKNNHRRCVHPFCMDCVANYIRVQVEETKARVKCPGLQCNRLLDPLICRPIITEKIFNKWMDCLCESVVLDYPRCSCPNKNCQELIIDECEKIATKCNCPRCKTLFCFRCEAPWHAGFRCDETSQIRTQDDIAFGRLLEQHKWTRCPRCGQPIERKTGCPEIICRCGNVFCYICGKRHDFAFCDGYSLEDKAHFVSGYLLLLIIIGLIIVFIIFLIV